MSGDFGEEKMRAAGLSRRGFKGIWQHARRVPKRYEHLESRQLIRTSLHTQDYSLALAKAAQIELLQNQEWELALQSQANSTTTRAKFDRLKQIAELRGYTYLPADQVAHLPLNQVCDRVEQSARQTLSAPAILGETEPPKLTTKDWLDTYQGHVEEKLVNHSPEQKHRWYLTRVRAVSRFVEAVGEKSVSDISRQEALAFRRWWRDRLAAKGLNPNTANKDFNYLSAMWNTLAKLEGWPMLNPFTGLSFAEAESARQAFSADWIETKLLAPDALESLNDQARDILLIMVNTGARPSELVNLTAEHIRLDHDIPHIRIRADGRRLKNRYSERDLPLIGCALEAMKRHPQGFPRYRHKAGHWSNLATKHLRQRGLLESPQHTPYSLRHAISDRLQNAGCEDRTRKEIMGHRPEGIIYGSGSSLETKADWLARVGFK